VGYVCGIRVFHSPHLALLPLQYLRPASLSPGLSLLLSAGVAGRSWRGDGAGVDRCSFRLCIWSSMAFGAHAGREVVDLIGQIWHCLALLLCLVELRWPEPEITTRKLTCEDAQFRW
jgi:hypothetical protein